MQEREQAMRLRVGLFVLGLLTLFMVFVLIIGSQRRIFDPRYTLHAFFGSIEGLNVGAPVRLAGASAGTVSEIRFARDLASKKIRVTVSLDSTLQERIREDSIASIGTIGLVGDKVLEVTVGSPDKPELRPGAVLASIDPPDYTSLLQKGDKILDNVVKISDAVRQLTGTGTGTEARQDLAETLGSLRRVVQEIEQGDGLLHALVYDKRSGDALKELSEVTASLKRMANTWEAGDGLLPALFHDPRGPDILQDLQRAARGLNDLMAGFQKQKGLAHVLFADARAGRILADLEETSANLRSVSSRLARGEGTLGALIDDPTLYEDLSSLLRGANRSLVLRTLIQSSRQAGASAAPK